MFLPKPHYVLTFGMVVVTLSMLFQYKQNYLLSFADNSLTTMTNNTTSDTPARDFTLRIIPEQIALKPLQVVQFKALVTTPDGLDHLAPKDYTIWSIHGGGGQISQDGEFLAGYIPGDFLSTITVSVLGKQATASVRIADTVNVSPSPTPGLTIVSITPTNKPLAPPFPTLTPAPINTPAIEPQDDSIIPIFQTPTPTLIDPQNLPSSTPIPPKTPTPFVTKPPFTTVAPNTQSTKTITTSNIYNDSQTQLCLRTVYGDEIYRTYFDPTGDKKDSGELGTLISAAQRCYKTTRNVNIDEETQTCLKNTLTPKRFTEISVDKAQPTAEEYKLAKQCTTAPNEITYVHKSNVDPTLVECLKIYLGRDELSQIIEKNRKPNPEEIQKARLCFSLDEEVTQPPIIATLPEETTSCLVQVIGESRIKEIQSHTSIPTDDETTRATECFSQTLDSTQTTFMPVASEQLPFLKTATSSETSITRVRAQTYETTEVLLLSGKATPLTVVDIYIFSNPIIVSTTADANGDWTYELSYHLEDGTHEAYSVVQHPEKGYVKSEVMSFNVAHAQATSDTTLPELLVEPIAPSTIATRNYLVVTVGIVIIGVIILLIGYYWFIKNNHSEFIVENQPDQV